MPRIEFEIIDHGCDGASYFPGCGTAFSKYTDCVTGIGDSAREAAEDAAESLYSSCNIPTHDQSCLHSRPYRAEDPCSCWRAAFDAELDREINALSDTIDTFTVRDCEDAEESGEELNEEWHHFVSIRWRIAEDN